MAVSDFVGGKEEKELFDRGLARIMLRTTSQSMTKRTQLVFQHDAKLYKLQTVVTALVPFSALTGTQQSLFKVSSEGDHVVVTEGTIFHPQGGGQPSDEGTMTAAADSAVFHVAAARKDDAGLVLHLGHFGVDGARFEVGQAVEQTLDAEKRLLHSRFHTAGHVLGAAVRHLLEQEIDGFDELKASHFPDSAACEFRGLIDGRWKGPIQERLDDYVRRAMPVEIDWWDEDDFRANGLGRLIPERSQAAPGEKLRVVKIVGAEVYPCGGTHVDTTDLCGKTTVKKIARTKGTSRISYTVA